MAEVQGETVGRPRPGSLLTKIHIIKAIFFPVVMYRCEGWTIKKAEPELML